MSHIIEGKSTFQGDILADDKQQAADIQRLQRRMDMLDQRLDNIDSIVTNVAERILSQAIVVNLQCPHCGKGIEIAIVGNQKPKGR